MNEVHIPAGRATLAGNLNIPVNATALVLFAHGSGSSRHSPRNQFVARTLNDAGLATLLFDLLTPEEELVDTRTAELRFDIDLLAERLVHATTWVKQQQQQTRDLRIGYFGSSTGGGAALVAAAQLPEDVGAVVSRGGRPDLAGAALPKVQAPTLLVWGNQDGLVPPVYADEFASRLRQAEIALVDGAGHLPQLEQPDQVRERVLSFLA